MIRYAIAVAVVGVVGAGFSPAQSDQCAPGQRTEAQTARRKTAIGLARQVNTGEAALFGKLRRYGTLSELSGVKPPAAGFEIQLSADTEGYTFAVKDIVDACHYAAFSDQKGIIYDASPIQ